MLHDEIQLKRRLRGLSQVAAAKKAGIGRSTSGKIESQAIGSVAFGTVQQYLETIGLTIEVLECGQLATLQRQLARAEAKQRSAQKKSQHIALAVRLDETSIAQARSVIALWRRNQTCSEEYICRWTDILEGTPAEIRDRILVALESDWANALVQNTPFAFVLDRQSS